jgi:PAS domain S-box-containing protein
MSGSDTSRNQTEERMLHHQTAVLNGINRVFLEALTSETEQALGRACLAVAEEITLSKFGFIGETNDQGRLDNIAISDPGWDACRIENRAGHGRVPLGFAIHGVYGRVLLDGSGFFTNDPASHPDNVGIPEGHPPLTAFLGVPLIHGGKTIGMVGVGNREGGYRDEDLAALEALAPAIVHAFMRKRAEGERERLLEQLKVANEQLAAESERSRELAAQAEATADRLASIQQVTDAAMAHLGLDDLLADLLRRIRQVLAADNATILLPTEDGKELVVRASSGLEEEVTSEVRVPIGRGIAGRIAASRESLRVDDLSDFEVWSPILRANVSSLIGVPLLTEGKLIGVLHVDSMDPRHFTDDALRLLQLVADRAALAIENARLLRQAHLDKARWQTTVDSMLDPVTVGDAEGHATYMNAAYTRLVGITIQNGLPLEDHSTHYQLYHPDGTIFDPTELPLQRAALRDEDVRNVEIVEGTGWGDKRIALWNAAPLHDEGGQVIGSVAVGRDITAQRRAESERERLLEDLQTRAAELDVANKELEAFSYSVSHDLRAPLRGIDGFSHALLEEYSDVLGEPGREYLQIVRTETHRMADLIDALLILSRVTRAEMSREDVDLSGLARRIAADLSKSDPERQVEFEIAPGVVANGDSRLLEVVMQNLLANAWKFTASHPRARIEFGEIEQEGTPEYFVRDDGAGFDMSYAGKLFGAFQRLHSQKEFSGTGVGLATVQRIVHRHGGRIWAEGQVEMGATFHFTL